VQLRGDRAKFKRLGANVVLIGLGTPERAKWFCEDKEIPFICVADPDVSAHRAYGLRRGSLRQVLGPQVYLRWTKARLLGDMPLPRAKLGEDVMQMPGTFVIDTGGIVRYAHRNTDVTDNPPNEEVLAVLREIARKTA
jgi:peroxiredoxin